MRPRTERWFLRCAHTPRGGLHEAEEFATGNYGLDIQLIPGSRTSAQDMSLRARGTDCAGPGETRMYAPPNVAFRVVSGRRRPEVRGYLAVHDLARSSPVYASYIQGGVRPVFAGWP